MATPIDEVLDEIDDTICAVCFDAIDRKLNKVKRPQRKILASLVERNVSCPLFVTWMITDPNGNEGLRGCIGTLAQVPIARLGRYAELSAFDDDRFNPVTDEEVPRLICAVSLLHSYEDAADLHDWEIGKHGVQVTFDVKGEEYSSTYLPEVAEEHNLTKDVAIRQLIRKAGYRGPINDKLMALIKVTRYQSKKFRMTYEEYTLLGEEAESEQ